MNTYYEVLGLPEDATADQIKTAYRKLARTVHPDVTGDRESGLFDLVTQAFDVLGTPAKRKAYDAAMAAGDAPRRSGTENFSSDPAATARAAAAAAAQKPAAEWWDIELTPEQYREEQRIWRGTVAMAASVLVAVLATSSPLLGAVFSLKDGAELILGTTWDDAERPALLEIIVAVVMCALPCAAVFFFAMAARVKKPFLATPGVIDVTVACAVAAILSFGGWVWFADAGVFALLGTGLLATAVWVGAGAPLKVLLDNRAVRALKKPSSSVRRATN